MSEIISLPLEIIRHALQTCSPSSLKIWLGLYLEGYDSKNDTICVANSKLKKTCNLSHITVSKSISELTQAKLVTVTNIKAGSRASTYSLRAKTPERNDPKEENYIHSQEHVALDEQALLEQLNQPIFRLWQNSLTELEVRKIYDEERQNHRYLRPTLFEDYFDQIIWEQYLELTTETSSREFLYLSGRGQLKWDHIKSVLKS